MHNSDLAGGGRRRSAVGGGLGREGSGWGSGAAVWRGVATGNCIGTF
jgi:hypothetical protein